MLYAVNYKLSDNLDQVVCELRWGYSNKKPIQKEKLYVYRRAISDHLKALKGKYAPCLCPNEFQVILEDALSLVGLSCCKDPQRRDLIIDKSGVDDWNLLNTGCIVYDEWEKSFRKVCPTIGIRVEKAETLDEVSKLIYTITSRRLDTCSILYNVKMATISMQENCFDYRWSVEPEVCNITALATVSKVDLEKCMTYGLKSSQIAECKIAYDALVAETRCDMTFDTYIDLMSCALPGNVIENMVKSGLKVTYSQERQCPVLNFDAVAIHLYEDLDLNNLTEDIFSCDFKLIDADGDES